MRNSRWAAAPVIVLAGLGLAACSTSSPTASVASTPVAPTTHTATARPSPTGLSMAQIDAMVRTLYYGESQAFLASTKDGLAYDLAHDYPGSVDRQKFQSCAATDEAQFPGLAISEVPEMDTLAPDPAWTGPTQSGTADWAFAGKKPKGQTYILTVDATVSSSSQPSSTSKTQVHVTVLNDKAYFYITACNK